MYTRTCVVPLVLKKRSKERERKKDGDGWIARHVRRDGKKGATESTVAVA